MKKEDPTKVDCPFCKKIFARMNSQGELTRVNQKMCRDYVGEGLNWNFTYINGFEIIPETWSAYEYGNYDTDILDLIRKQGGRDFKLANHLDMSEFMESIDEIVIYSFEQDGFAPGTGGDYSFVLIEKESQEKLLKQLRDLKIRLTAWSESTKAGMFTEWPMRTKRKRKRAAPEVRESDTHDLF